MKSQTSPEFWKHFRRLPDEVKDQARATFKAWQSDPTGRGFKFKRLTPHDIYSIRIGGAYRAICFLVQEDTYVWDWIGTHDDYDKELKRLKRTR